MITVAIIKLITPTIELIVICPKVANNTISPNVIADTGITIFVFSLMLMVIAKYQLQMQI